MKKVGIFFVIFIFTFVLFPQRINACMRLDAEFTLTIGNLPLDLEKLNSQCTEVTCYIGEKLISIRSVYNSEVMLILPRSQGQELIVRLPYKKNDMGQIEADAIDPVNYNWQESLRSDLLSLKDKGVVNLSVNTIDSIANIAMYQKNIGYCSNTWVAIPNNCLCDNTGKEGCVKCTGSPTLDAQIPSDSFLQMHEDINSMNSSKLIIPGITGGTMVICVVTFILIKKKRINKQAS